MERKYRTLYCVYSDLLLVVFYVLFVLSALYGNFLRVLSIIGFILYILIKIIFGVRNIIMAIELGIENDEETLFKLMKKSKYGSIWVFVINFIVNFIVIGFVCLILMHWVILAFPYIAFIVFMTYIDVVFTSCFGIIFIIMKKVRGEVSGFYMILHILIMLCFVLDIVDTVYLSNKFKNSVKKDCIHCNLHKQNIRV